MDKVSFIDKVQVDIKNQQYSISFKEQQAIDFDALAKAVEDAGFSVAKFVVTANVGAFEVEKDQHIKIGDFYFHFLNASHQHLSGETSFTLVDRKFVSAKEFKKYSALSKMPCVLAGRAAKCCSSDTVPEQARIYHTII